MNENERQVIFKYPFKRQMVRPSQMKFVTWKAFCKIAYIVTMLGHML